MIQLSLRPLDLLNCYKDAPNFYRMPPRTCVDWRWIRRGKRARKGCTTETVGSGSPEMPGEQTGRGFEGEEARGASMDDGKVARAAHEQREELVRAVSVRVAGGGTEKNSGELLWALELTAWVAFARGGKGE